MICCSALVLFKVLRHLFKGHLVSVWVQRRQEVDACFFDEVGDALVSALVLLAHVLHQVEQQLPTQNLVSVHPCNISELWFACRGRQRTVGELMRGSVETF